MKHIIANWKMNLNLKQVEKWLDEFSNLIEKNKPSSKIILAGSFPHLAEISNFCLEHNIDCSAQDVSASEKGARTGSVGAFQLKDFCQFCIVGHSERKEPRDEVLSKRDACLKSGITPIVCFTKKEAWRQNHTDNALLAWEDPDNISKDGVYREKDTKEIIEAYEFFAREASDLSIIYGGSVHRGNISELVSISNLGGVLVGNASLDPKHFLELISAFE